MDIFLKFIIHNSKFIIVFEEDISSGCVRDAFGFCYARFRKTRAEKQFCQISALDLRSLATEGTQEFPPLNFHLRALSIMNCELWIKIPTVEKNQFLHITSCRTATMRVTNSRLLMLPNSEIRQNEEKGTMGNIVANLINQNKNWNIRNYYNNIPLNYICVLFVEK